MPEISRGSRIITDLHNHTVMSDGQFAPSEFARKFNFVARQLNCGLMVVSMTEHSRFEAIAYAYTRALMGELNPQLMLLPGFELDTFYVERGQTKKAHLGILRSSETPLRAFQQESISMTKQKLTTEEAIKINREAGGISIIYHPNEPIINGMTAYGVKEMLDRGVKPDAIEVANWAACYSFGNNFKDPSPWVASRFGISPVGSDYLIDLAKDHNIATLANSDAHFRRNAFGAAYSKLLVDRDLRYDQVFGYLKEKMQFADKFEPCIDPTLVPIFGREEVWWHQLLVRLLPMIPGWMPKADYDAATYQHDAVRVVLGKLGILHKFQMEERLKLAHPRSTTFQRDDRELDLLGDVSPGLLEIAQSLGLSNN